MNRYLLPPQYDQIAALLEPFGAYLVGGAVRDLGLGQPVHDLDFALPGQTLQAGRKLADRLGGAVFTMDRERATVRVILGGGGNARLMIDLTVFQGESIQQDLAARDFTITSMAQDCEMRDPVVDPFQGRQDLLAGLIRATSATSLADDPLRCLRAVRLAAQLGFRITPDTASQIRSCSQQLGGISGERIRDELFRILEGPSQTAAVLSLKALGLYAWVLPGELSARRSRTLRSLAQIWSLFQEPHDQERAGDWYRGLLVHRLGRYRDPIRTLLGEEPVAGRRLFELSLLLPLLEGLEDDPAGHLAGLALSNQELAILESSLQAAEDFRDLAAAGGSLQALDVYRYFRGRETSGLLGIFLVLAGSFEEQGLERASWVGLLEKARILLEGYWEHYLEWIDPPALLDGSQLIQEFGLQPGPRIGELLESLRQEQVVKGLQTPDSAREYLKAQLAQGSGSSA